MSRNFSKKHLLITLLASTTLSMASDASGVRAASVVLPSDVTPVLSLSPSVTAPSEPIKTASVVPVATVPVVSPAQPAQTAWGRFLAILSGCCRATDVVIEVAAGIAEATGDKKTADALRIADAALDAGVAITDKVTTGLATATTTGDILRVAAEGAAAGMVAGVGIASAHGGDANAARIASTVAGIVSAAGNVAGSVADRAGGSGSTASKVVGGVGVALSGAVSIAANAAGSFGAADVAGHLSTAGAILDGVRPRADAAIINLADGHGTGSDVAGLVHVALDVTSGVVAATGNDAAKDITTRVVAGTGHVLDATGLSASTASAGSAIMGLATPATGAIVGLEVISQLSGAGVLHASGTESKAV